MSKRPSLLSGLTLPPPAAAEQLPDRGPEAVADPTPPPQTKGSVGRRVRPDVIHTSVYLPREVHRHLREIAFTRDVKVHDVIMEGIDAALQKHGHPPVTSLRAKDKA